MKRTLGITLGVSSFLLAGFLLLLVGVYFYTRPPVYKHWPYQKGGRVVFGETLVEYADVAVPYKDGRPRYANRIIEHRSADNRLVELEWGYVKLDGNKDVTYFRLVRYQPALFGIMVPDVLYEVAINGERIKERNCLFPEFCFFSAFREL